MAVRENLTAGVLMRRLCLVLALVALACSKKLGPYEQAQEDQRKASCPDLKSAAECAARLEAQLETSARAADAGRLAAQETAKAASAASDDDVIRRAIALMKRRVQAWEKPARVRQERCLVAQAVADPLLDSVSVGAVMGGGIRVRIVRRVDSLANTLGETKDVFCERADVPATLARLLGEVAR